MNPTIATTMAPINNKGMTAETLFLSAGKICLISGNMLKSASVYGFPVAGLTNVIFNFTNFHLIFSLSKGPATMISTS